MPDSCAPAPPARRADSGGVPKKYLQGAAEPLQCVSGPVFSPRQRPRGRIRTDPGIAGGAAGARSGAADGASNSSSSCSATGNSSACSVTALAPSVTLGGAQLSPSCRAASASCSARCQSPGVGSVVVVTLPVPAVSLVAHHSHPATRHRGRPPHAGRWSSRTLGVRDDSGGESAAVALWQPLGRVASNLLAAVQAGRGERQVVQVAGEASTHRQACGAWSAVVRFRRGDDVLDVGFLETLEPRPVVGTHHAAEPSGDLGLRALRIIVVVSVRRSASALRRHYQATPPLPGAGRAGRYLRGLCRQSPRSVRGSGARWPWRSWFSSSGPIGSHPPPDGTRRRRRPPAAVNTGQGIVTKQPAVVVIRLSPEAAVGRAVAHARCCTLPA